ncbi:MAG: hypothetical protein WD013_02105 [Gemmatimonadota bacterium]
MRFRSRTFPSAFILISFLLPTGAALAQSATEVMSEYSNIYQERLEGIRDLYVVQSVMGMTTSTYFEKTDVAGTFVLQPQLIETGGTRLPIEAGSSEQLWGDPSAYLLEFSERAELDGMEIVDGVETTVVRVVDLTDLEFSAPGQPQGPGAREFRPRQIRVFLDTEEWVVRRMETVADATTATGSAEVTADVDFADFREVEGLPYPHHMTVSVAGLDGAVSPREMEQARTALEQLRNQLESMPEVRREAVESMMGDQMDRLMEALESGSLTMEVRIQEIRVNEGPPAD